MSSSLRNTTPHLHITHSKRMKVARRRSGIELEEEDPGEDVGKIMEGASRIVLLRANDLPIDDSIENNSGIASRMFCCEAASPSYKKRDLIQIS